MKRHMMNTGYVVLAAAFGVLIGVGGMYLVLMYGGDTVLSW